MTTPAARNVWVGRLLVEELARLDTPLVCLAPGARCAPLSMALGEPTSRVPWVTFVDERAAAFHAVGVARATGRPAVVVTTSGTAVGNLAPAVMEADQAGVPLILITADRPAELRQTGANQTVRQSSLLAPLVRYHADLPCSDPGLSLRAVLSTLDEAVHAARDRRGPVHLNLQFREPLGPAESPVPAPVQAWWSDPRRTPWVQSERTLQAPSPRLRDHIAGLSAVQRGLIVVGSLPPTARPAAQAFVEALGWPVTCSPDSGLSGGVLGLDSALSDPVLASRLAPETVLWLGGGVVSKRIVTWLREASDALELFAITERDVRVDPAFRVRERFVVDYDHLPALLATRAAPSEEWLSTWSDLHAVACRVVASTVSEWTEHAAARAVLARSESVFLGASLPVRLADWVGSGGRPVNIDANRGASGIDGVMATAAGWARHSPGRCRVLLGDLTCLHDQGSLPLLRETGLQAVVLNNLGGSIFGMLPFGEVSGFDRVFRNVHERGLAPIAQAMGLRTATVDSLSALTDALDDTAIDFVEARFDHDATLGAVRALHADTCAALRDHWALT